MTRLSFLRWSIFGYFLLLGLLPSAAYASDCPPDDPSRADCQNAASSARSPLVPIAGAAAGGMAGWVLGQALEPRTETEAGEEEQEKTKGEPCQAELNRYAEAAMRARILQASREGFQNLLNSLEVLYENARQAAFWGASLDVAFMAGSLWTKPVAGLLGRELLEQTLGEKLREAALKTFGQELTKSLMSSMDQQGIDWGKVAVGKPLEGTYMTAIQEGVTKQLVRMEMERFAIYGIKPGGPVGQALERMVANEIAGPLVEGYFGIKGVYDTLAGTSESAEKLQAIRAELSRVHQNLLAADEQFADALEDMSMRRATLEHCRTLWAQR